MWGWVQKDGNSGWYIYTGDFDCVAKQIHLYCLSLSMESSNSKCPRLSFMYFVRFVYFNISCHLPPMVDVHCLHFLKC